MNSRPNQERIRDAKSRLAKAEEHYAQKRYAEAEQEYRKALEWFPQTFRALVNLGNTLSQQHRYQEAISEYDKAMVLQPSNIILLFNRSCVLAELDQYDLASDGFERCLDLDPDHPLALPWLIDSCQKCCDWSRMKRYEPMVKARIAAGKPAVIALTGLGLPYLNAADHLAIAEEAMERKLAAGG